MPNRNADVSMSRVPPQNLEAEQAVLGAMLLSREAIARAGELVRPEDFYREAHRWIYRGILELYQQNEPADLITLGEWLRARGSRGAAASEDESLLAQVGGTTYLSTIMTAPPTAAGAAHYAAIVRDKALQRQLIAAADEILQEAYAGDRPVETLVRAGEGKLFDLGERVRHGGAAVMPDVYTIGRQAIDRRREADAQGFDVGFKTGLRALNRVLQPIKPGEMVVVAGRPAMGKSAFSMQLAVSAAEQGMRGIFFSLEMDQDSLAMRLLLSHGFDQWKANSLLYRVAHADEVYGALEGALDTLRELPLYVVDVPQLCGNDLLHLGRRAKYEGGLDFIVVDYLQLMDANERHADTFERVRAISRELKLVAKTLKVAVIAISQLSRQVESRTPPRPMMSDLRESGQLEQDADKILLLYRPGYYGKRAQQAAELADDDTTSTEVILAKQRNGPTDAVWTRFDPRRTWFCDTEE